MKEADSLANDGSHKIGRDEHYFCGSGGKYKKCCLSANSNEAPVHELHAQEKSWKNLQVRVEDKFKDQDLIIRTSEGMGLVSRPDIIVEFVQDLLEAASNYTEQRNVLTLAIAAWNVAILSEDQGNDPMIYLEDFPLLTKLQDDPGLNEIMTNFLLMLIERKHKEYPHVHRFIGDYEITKLKKGHFDLNLMSVLLPSSRKPKKPLRSRFLG
jgi:hypothetical protein